ncbi:hypothetical protein RSOL_448830 [Rhizoctonia solani AG-3 Rhs1AP]|uniref:Transmembrane protein n=1 Tax=Rhizoctonia solani AG-3 Rhs1AP TaxID=1086054 RepID=X8JR03_9AGAM|nr:hypothetical protein RSOL_448830 [Rhizoctonia solani AG-3 Rhs1AP]
MFKLTRAFVIAAAVTSSALCAPVPQDVGKAISTGQSADPYASASTVFGTVSQDPNYQSRPTGLCVVPALAKDAGLSQGQNRLIVQQAIQLCPDASTIAVSSKNSKRGMKTPNVAPPVPSSSPEPHPDAPHPVRAADGHPTNVEIPPKPTHESLPGALQPPVARDLPPQPKVAPSSIPQPHTPHPVRSDVKQPPKVEVPPRPSPEPQVGAAQPHVARDPPPRPDALHPIAVRSESEPHRDPQSLPLPSPQPEPQPDVPHPVAARSAPKAEVPAHAQPLPATLPRPSQLI